MTAGERVVKALEEFFLLIVLILVFFIIISIPPIIGKVVGQQAELALWILYGYAAILSVTRAVRR